MGAVTSCCLCDNEFLTGSDGFAGFFPCLSALLLCHHVKEGVFASPSTAIVSFLQASSALWNCGQLNPLFLLNYLSLSLMEGPSMKDKERSITTPVWKPVFYNLNLEVISSPPIPFPLNYLPLCFLIAVREPTVEGRITNGCPFCN